MDPNQNLSGQPHQPQPGVQPEPNVLYVHPQPSPPAVQPVAPAAAQSGTPPQPPAQMPAAALPPAYTPPATQFAVPVIPPAPASLEVPAAQPVNPAAPLQPAQVLQSGQAAQADQSPYQLPARLAQYAPQSPAVPAAGAQQPAQVQQPPYAQPQPAYQATQPAYPPQQTNQPLQPGPAPRPLITNDIMYHMGPVSIKKRLANIIVVILLAASFLAGIIMLAGLIRQPGRYKDLQEVSIQETGSVTDGKYTLKIPKEFVVDLRDADSIRYVHVESEEPDAEVLATVSATAVYAGENNIADLRAELTKQAMEQNGAVYDGFIVDHIKAVLSDLNGELNADSFSEGTAANEKPSLFSTFGFKKTDGTQFKGKILVVYGEKHLFILTAVAGKDKWNSNNKVWDEVFNSFTVDTAAVN